MARNKPMPNERIAAVLEAHLRMTGSYLDGGLAKENEKVLKYYDGTAPAPTHAGNSKYVSQDVFESVESAKATLLETFSTNQRIVSFDPSGPDDVEPSRIATEFCSYIVFRQNDGFGVLGTVIEDGLLARNGVCQFWYEENTEEVEEQYTGSQEAVAEKVAPGEIEVDSIDENDDGTITAYARRKVDSGMVRIEAVPPEDFFITSRATDIKSAKLVARRHVKTRGELLDEGYDQKDIDQLSADSIDANLDPQKTVRFEDIDRGTIDDDSNDLETFKAYTIYECYPKLDVDGTGIPKLWRIVKCGNYILKKEKVSTRPFAVYTPIPKGHSFYGNNFASKVVPIQNARSVLTRAILDHAVTTTAPRWQVVKGGLMNPRELMDNRVGGIVNVNRPDAVAPLAQAPLNPYVFQVIAQMDQNKEDVTGISRLAKGLNRDAISTQNSQGLVEDLVSLSERRQKIMARQFSEFLRQLYVGIYQLVVDHVDRQCVFEVAGNWVEIDPSKWRTRTSCSAEITVGYGDQQREVQKWVEIDQYMSQPSLKAMYDDQRRYNVLRRAMEKKGVKDIDNVLVPLAQQKPLPPDPMMMAEIEAKKAQAQAQLATANAAMARIQAEQRRWEMQLAQQHEKLVADHALKSDALSLKERAELHREWTAEQELTLSQKELEQADKVSATAISAPNG